MREYDITNLFAASFYQKKVAEVCLNCEPPRCMYPAGCEKYREACRAEAAKTNFSRKRQKEDA